MLWATMLLLAAAGFGALWGLVEVVDRFQGDVP